MINSTDGNYSNIPDEQCWWGKKTTFELHLNEPCAIEAQVVV